MSLRLFHRPARRALLFTDEDRQLLRDALDAAAGDRTLLRMALTNAEPGGWERLARRAGGVIAVASLALVAWQAVEASSSARASADAVRATAWAAATQAVLTYDQTALQSDPNGNLDPFFVEGRLLSNAIPHGQASRFTQLALMQLDLLDGYRGLAEFLPDFVDQESVRGWHRQTLRDGPALCQVLNRYREGFAAEFVRESATYCPADLLSP
jgi:hypothetical protein